MSEVIHGTIHGKTIHLDEDPGLPDGETVEVVVGSTEVPPVWGEGLRRCAGALADDPEAERILEEIQRERKADNRPEMSE